MPQPHNSIREAFKFRAINRSYLSNPLTFGPALVTITLLLIAFLYLLPPFNRRYKSDIPLFLPAIEIGHKFLPPSLR